MRASLLIHSNGSLDLADFLKDGDGGLEEGDMKDRELQRDVTKMSRAVLHFQATRITGRILVRDSLEQNARN